MQRYFSNDPPVYSKPKSQSGPAGSRPSQEDTTSRPPPPVPRPRPPIVQPPPPIASPLASPPSRPTPPPKPTSTISPAIPPPLPPAAPAHTPHSDYHSPISTQYHTTVSLDRDPCSARSFRPNLNSRPFLRSHLYRRLYFRLLHSPCTAPLQPTYTIEIRPSEQLFNLSRRHSLGGLGPRQYNRRIPFRVHLGEPFLRAIHNQP